MKDPDDWWLEHASGGKLTLLFAIPILALILLVFLSYGFYTSG